VDGFYTSSSILSRLYSLLMFLLCDMFRDVYYLRACMQSRGLLSGSIFVPSASLGSLVPARTFVSFAYSNSERGPQMSAAFTAEYDVSVLKPL